eukprot:jgi/Mesvir1/5035/Mv02240-RA.1
MKDFIFYHTSRQPNRLGGKNAGEKSKQELLEEVAAERAAREAVRQQKRAACTLQRVFRGRRAAASWRKDMWREWEAEFLATTTMGAASGGAASSNQAQTASGTGTLAGGQGDGNSQLGGGQGSSSLAGSAPGPRVWTAHELSDKMLRPFLFLWDERTRGRRRGEEGAGTSQQASGRRQSSGSSSTTQSAHHSQAGAGANGKVPSVSHASSHRGAGGKVVDTGGDLADAGGVLLQTDDCTRMHACCLALIRSLANSDPRLNYGSLLGGLDGAGCTATAPQRRAYLSQAGRLARACCWVVAATGVVPDATEMKGGQCAWPTREVDVLSSSGGGGANPFPPLPPAKHVALMDAKRACALLLAALTDPLLWGCRNAPPPRAAASSAYVSASVDKDPLAQGVLADASMGAGASYAPGGAPGSVASRPGTFSLELAQEAVEDVLWCLASAPPAFNLFMATRLVAMLAHATQGTDRAATTGTAAAPIGAGAAGTTATATTGAAANAAAAAATGSSPPPSSQPSSTPAAHVLEQQTLLVMWGVCRRALELLRGARGGITAAWAALSLLTLPAVTSSLAPAMLAGLRSPAVLAPCLRALCVPLDSLAGTVARMAGAPTVASAGVSGGRGPSAASFAAVVEAQVLAMLREGDSCQPRAGAGEVGSDGPDASDGGNGRAAISSIPPALWAIVNALSLLGQFHRTPTAKRRGQDTQPAAAVADSSTGDAGHAGTGGQPSLSASASQGRSSHSTGVHPRPSPAHSLAAAVANDLEQQRVTDGDGLLTTEHGVGIGLAVRALLAQLRSLQGAGGRPGSIHRDSVAPGGSGAVSASKASREGGAGARGEGGGARNAGTRGEAGGSAGPGSTASTSTPSSPSLEVHWGRVAEPLRQLLRADTLQALVDACAFCRARAAIPERPPPPRATSPRNNSGSKGPTSGDDNEDSGDDELHKDESEEDLEDWRALGLVASKREAARGLSVVLDQVSQQGDLQLDTCEVALLYSTALDLFPSLLPPTSPAHISSVTVLNALAFSRHLLPHLLGHLLPRMLAPDPAGSTSGAANVTGGASGASAGDAPSGGTRGMAHAAAPSSGSFLLTSVKRIASDMVGHHAGHRKPAVLGGSSSAAGGTSQALPSGHQSGSPAPEQIIVLGAGVAGVPPPLVPVLTLFSSAYAHLLLILDEEEFYTKQTPFTLPQQVALATSLNALVYHTFVPVAPPVATGASPPLSLLSPSSSAPSPFASVSPAERRASLTALSRAATGLLMSLHQRDARRPFCPPSLWLAPAAASPPPKYLLVLRPQEGDRDAHGGGASSREEPSMAPAGATIASSIPHVLPFADRVELFRATLREQGLVPLAHADGAGGRAGRAPKLAVTIRRDHLLEDAFAQLGGDRAAGKLRGALDVRYVNAQGVAEAGIDMGGLFKEFVTDLAKAVFDPQLGLFQATQGDGLLYPRGALLAGAALGMDAFPLAQFAGRVMGKALAEGVLLELGLAGFFVTRIVGRQNYLEDLPTLDAQLHKNLMYLKRYEGDASDLSLTFTVSEDAFGRTVERELVPGGASLAVTDANKLHYIHAVADYHLNRAIKPITDAFVRGLSELVPPGLLQLFSPAEFNQLLSGGEDEIDIDDLRKNTRYSGGFADNSREVCIFWDVVAKFSPEEKRALLKFVTSCSRGPLLGFAHLNPKFTIHKVECDTSFWAVLGGADVDRLPTAATCHNMLKLPTYKRASTMREKLRYSIFSNSGFELS